jgi:hypothetical protein
MKEDAVAYEAENGPRRFSSLQYTQSSFGLLQQYRATLKEKATAEQFDNSGQDYTVIHMDTKEMLLDIGLGVKLDL